MNESTVRKPRVNRRDLSMVSPMSNREELIGKEVRDVRTGKVGRIVSAYTARDNGATGSYAECRGTYYSVEMDDRIIVGVSWEDVMRM